MSVSVEQPEMNFRQYTGEPNRRNDLENLGLVKPGVHPDIKTTTITMAGRERVIRVSPIISYGEDGNLLTVLRPIKADFRRAVRELTGDMSLRSLARTR